jgi:pyruvate/2-oxoglutarate dehydrogenase complex dihydrolipoamide acyltransferase (E2) component
MATSAATLMTIIETMVENRPKTVDRAVELLDAKGLLPAKLLADRIKVTPKKESRFASVEAEVFAVEQRIAIPEGFRGSGKVDNKITIVDLRALLTGKTGAEPKEPKAAKAPKEPKEPKAAKAPKAPKPEVDARVTKKVRDLLHEWGLDESALEGIQPTAYKGTKFGVGDIAHLEPGATGGKKKSSGKDKASSSASAPSAPSESSDSDSDSDSDTEEQDDDFDPFDALKAKP